jgi:hypothetical protein
MVQEEERKPITIRLRIVAILIALDCYEKEFSKPICTGKALGIGMPMKTKQKKVPP